jgi:hypothetical protein
VNGVDILRTRDRWGMTQNGKRMRWGEGGFGTQKGRKK